MTFTIDTENNITAHPSSKAARETGFGVFSTPEQLAVRRLSSRLPCRGVGAEYFGQRRIFLGSGDRCALAAFAASAAFAVPTFFVDSREDVREKALGLALTPFIVWIRRDALTGVDHQSLPAVVILDYALARGE